MADEAQQPRRRGGGFAWLLVLVLLGLVFWLTSERNARKWALVVENNTLVVQRGRFFPTGMRTLWPREFDGAYAPVPVPPGSKATEGEFEDRVSLDRALFDTFLPWARATAERPDSASQKVSMELAERAAHLPGLSPVQLDQLAQLRGDLAYTAALGEVQLAAGYIESARRRLLQSQQQGGARSLQSAALASELKGLADRLGDITVGRVQATQEPTPKATPSPKPASDAGTADAGSRPR